MKKLITALLSCTLMLSGLTGVAAEETKQEIVRGKPVPVGAEILASQDFSEDTSGFTTFGNVSPEKFSDGDKALRFKSASDDGIGIYYNDPLPRGSYGLTFDFYAESLDNCFFVMMHKQTATGLKQYDKSIHFMRFDRNGKASMWRDSYYAYDGYLRRTWEAKKWYSVGVYVDTDKRTVNVYLDGKCEVKMDMPDEMEDLKGFTLWHAGYTANEVWIDNLKFFRDPPGTVSGFDPVLIQYTTPEDALEGNNFYTDDPPEFHFTYENLLEGEEQAEISYAAYDYSGIEVWKKKPEALSLKFGEPVEKTLIISEPHYGRMTLTASVKRANGEIVTKDIPYTMSNNSLDTPQNYRSGVVTHLNGKGHHSKAFPLLARAGISTIRGPMPLDWAGAEKTKGVYTWSDEAIDFAAKAKEYGIDLLCMFYGNIIYNEPGMGGVVPPESKEGLQAVTNYIKELIRVADGAVWGVEVFNEWNNKAMTGDYIYRYDLFADLHRAIWKGAKESIDPKVVVAGLAEDNWAVFNTDAVENYLKAINGDQCFDAVATHPYTPNGEAPELGVSGKLKLAEQELLKKYGQDPDMPRLATEYGWSDEMVGGKLGEKLEKQAAYFVRAMGKTQAEDSVDRFYWYAIFDYMEYISDLTDREASFGIMQSPLSGGAEVPYIGKPSYVAIAYYNNLMAENTFVKDYSEGDNFAYLIKDRNDRDIIMMGPIGEEPMDCTLTLGCDSVTVGDINGNEHVQYGVNGTFDFKANEDEVLYVIGNFEEPQVTFEKGKNFSCSQSSIKVPINCNMEIDFQAPKDFDGVLKVQSFGVESAEEETSFENGVAKLHFRTMSAMPKKAGLVVTAEKDGKVYYRQNIQMSYHISGILDDQLHWSKDGQRSDLWSYSFDLSNIRSDESISGSLTYQNAGESTPKSFRIPEIAPGETRRIQVPLQRVNTVDNLGKTDATIQLSTGETLSINESETMFVCEYTDTPPTIDGVFSPGEWQENFYTMRLNNPKDVYYADAKYNGTYGGEEDNSSKLFLKYDEDNFYLGVEVTDDVFHQVNGEDQMWAGDSIQILIAFDKNSSSGTQYCIGLADGKNPSIHRYFQEANTTGYFGLGANAAFLDGEQGITCSQNKTYYEVKIPWDKIRYGGGKPERGDMLYFSALVNDSDGEGRRLWMEYGLSNIGAGYSSPAKAMRMLLDE